MTELWTLFVVYGDDHVEIAASDAYDQRVGGEWPFDVPDLGPAATKRSPRLVVHDGLTTPYIGNLTLLALHNNRVSTKR